MIINWGTFMQSFYNKVEAIYFRNCIQHYLVLHENSHFFKINVHSGHNSTTHLEAENMSSRK
jgi:hypothetical protein